TGRSETPRLGRRALWGAGAAVAGAAALVALLGRGRHGAFATERADTGEGASPAATDIPDPITPTGRFYVVSKNFIDPSIDPRRWRLEIGGLVGRPLALSLEALKALPIAPVEQVTTLCCISNPVGGGFVSTARWRGLPLSELLDYVQAKPGASWLHCWAADGYSDGMATAFAREPGVLVAWEMNGAPLTRTHGAPVRLLVPGRYGLKSVKWLTRMELLDAPAEGFWRTQGWSEGAEVNTFARLDWPDGRSLLRPGAVHLRGIAFAGRRGIMAVEVSLDSGRTWAAAQLEPLPDASQIAAWVPWTYLWPAVPGAYTAVVRAIDGTGAVQDATRRPPYPSGSTGYHTVSLRVVG